MPEPTMSLYKAITEAALRHDRRNVGHTAVRAEMIALVYGLETADVMATIYEAVNVIEATIRNKEAADA